MTKHKHQMTNQEYETALFEIWKAFYTYGPSYRNLNDFKLAYENLQKMKLKEMTK